MMEAKRLFEEGKASEANGILNAEDMFKDEENNLTTFEKNTDYVKTVYENLKHDIQAYLHKIDIIIADEGMSKIERYTQVNQIYDSLIKLQEEIGDESVDRTELLNKMKSLL